MATEMIGEAPRRAVRRGRGQAAEPQASVAQSAMETVAQVVAPPAVPGFDPAVEAKIDEQIQTIMATTRNVNTSITMQEIKLFPHHVEMNVNGLNKAISLLDFKRLLDEQLKVDTKLEPMCLPFNTYMFARSAGTLQIGCYYPERKMDLTHTNRYADEGKGKVYKGVIFPNLVITHTLSADQGVWKVTDSRYLVTDKKVTQLPEDQFVLDPKAGDRLWRVPFPNFYDEGRMCYGGNTMPNRFGNNLRGLDYYYTVIPQSPFNNDLGINVPSYMDNISGWFEFLTTQETFPYDKLSASRRH